MGQVGAYTIIDKLQPKTASYLSIASRSGSLTLPGTAMLIMEVMPTGLIESVANVALKACDGIANVFQLDGRVGYLAISSQSVDEVREAGRMVLDRLELEPPSLENRKVVASELVSRIDPQHAFITNKLKSGSMCVPGESLFIMECQPAPETVRAVNEAEKAADIKVVDFRFTGSMGRMILSGRDEEIRVAQNAALGCVAH